MGISNDQSWYVNPNTRQVTSNVRNTAIKDREAFNGSLGAVTEGNAEFFANEKTFYTALLNNLASELQRKSITEEKAMSEAAGQESETKTEMIVKPDGSRVLVMTMSVGGMETAMSLEISKPTKTPNENSKQGADRNMPTAENDTVSDEMPDISTEE